MQHSVWLEISISPIKLIDDSEAHFESKTNDNENGADLFDHFPYNSLFRNNQEHVYSDVGHLTVDRGPL